MSFYVLDNETSMLVIVGDYYILGIQSGTTGRKLQAGLVPYCNKQSYLATIMID